MATSGSKPAPRKRASHKPAARRRNSRQQPPPATLTGAHVQGFFAGALAGVLIGAAGVAWLIRETPATQPVPNVAQATTDGEAERPRFDFYKVLPEEDLNLAEGIENRPRAGDNAASDYNEYLLQAGAFRRPEDADTRKGELALCGLESRIVVSNGESGVWHQVRIGPFENRSAMAQARSLTAQCNISTLLMRRNNP